MTFSDKNLWLRRHFGVESTNVASVLESMYRRPSCLSVVISSSCVDLQEEDIIYLQLFKYRRLWYYIAVVLRDFISHSHAWISAAMRTTFTETTLMQRTCLTSLCVYHHWSYSVFYAFYRYLHVEFVDYIRISKI